MDHGHSFPQLSPVPYFSLGTMIKTLLCATSTCLGDSDAFGKVAIADLAHVDVHDIAALKVPDIVALALVLDDRASVVCDRGGAAVLGGVKPLALPMLECYRVKLYHARGSIDVAYGAA